MELASPTPTINAVGRENVGFQRALFDIPRFIEKTAEEKRPEEEKAREKRGWLMIRPALISQEAIL